MRTMRIRRDWAMPNKHTFTIKPIKRLIARHVKKPTWLDPFANNFRRKHVISNDINPKYDCDYNLDANEFLEKFENVEGVLFDPPYTPRQLKECYDGMGQSLTSEDTRLSTWRKWKESIASVIKPSGTCISFGFNSNGIGKVRDFEITEILLVAHGSNHNDTICTVERKKKVYGCDHFERWDE
jgi:hypothetical protein